MWKRATLAVLLLTGLCALGALSQPSATSALELQHLIVNQGEVQAAFGSSWTLVAKTEVQNPPATSQYSAALIYSDNATSMLASLFQFKQASEALAYANSDVLKAFNAKQVLSSVDQQTLSKEFNIGEAGGAGKVVLDKLLMGVRSDPAQDEQQLVLRLQVGNFEADYAVRLCIPAHPDPNSGATIEYRCFDEKTMTNDLIKLGQTQLQVLISGRS